MKPIQSAVPSLTTSQGAQQMLGTAPEPTGMSTAGGRRLSKMKKSKTRKAHKKSRKTRKH